jgi:4-carboxymuconolactone decarboxylase
MPAFVEQPQGAPMARLPVITTATPENKDAFDYLMKTRGAVRGGFAVTMVSPDITQRMAHVGTYARFDSPVAKEYRELAATVVSAEMNNPAEYTVHAKTCREVGISESLVKAVLDRAPVTGADEAQALIIDMARQLTRDHKLSQATFDAARKRFGDKDTVDLISVMGYYAMLAVVHVALDIQPGH